MIVVFNLIIIALVLLIAYWWANQGLFSSLLHFVCVVVAGAVALATWEPLSMLLLKQGWMDNYALGVSLLLPFAIYLLLARVLCDKVVGENLNFPQWANYVFGGAFGLASGVLSLGMCMLGGGFLQSSYEMFGFSGSVRTLNSKGQPAIDIEKLWLPVHKITASSYGYLGLRALAPETGRSIEHAYPMLADQAFSLHRDSAEKGKAKTTAPPDSVKLGRFFFSPDFENSDRTRGAYIVEMDVDNAAADSGGQVTVTASQVRLIEGVPSDSMRSARVAYADSWSQPLETGARQIYAFDDLLNVATNVPGQQNTKFFFTFPVSNLGTPEQGSTPQFIQFKGLRLRLPAMEADRPPDALAKGVMRGLGGSGAQPAIPLTDPALKSLASKDISATNSIEPAVVSINELTTMEQTDQLLTEGKQEFQRGGNQASKTNRIIGIYERDGTRVVRLNISRRSSSIDLWNDRTKLREEAGEQAALLLVDSQGNTYAPVGYIWVRPDGVLVYLDPRRGLETIGDFPPQPSHGNDLLFAIYTPTSGSKIVSVRLGNKPIANVDFEVPASK
ncbi:MAG: CvpA family protein [Phycisphaerae bacterium]|nr:CvpA family protein [Phycisphaerae bacterium]